MAQENIDQFLAMVRGKNPSELGPSLLLVNGLPMYDMLRAFEQMAADDRARFKQAAFDGIPGAGCNSTRTVLEASQVWIERILFAFIVATKKQVPSPIPGDLYETGQMVDAYVFLNKPAPTTTVWATCIGSVCEDARLRKKGDNDTIIGGDTTYGQAGWDVGIMYGTNQFNTLKKTMAAKCRGKLIAKFAINAHGEAGLFAVNGVDESQHPIGDAMSSLDLAGLKTKFADMFEFLNNVMTEKGIVLLQGCLAGLGAGGSTLLQQLSLQVRPRKFVGFARLGYQSVEKQKRDGEQCREPGARDTDDTLHASSEKEQFNRYFKDGQWDDLKILPWQSENSPHAKVAQNGVIIQGKDL